MRTLPDLFRQLGASARMLLVFTLVLGVGYPLVVLGIAQIPGLQGRADGQVVHVHGKAVGSAILGQAFTDAKGNPLVQYLQARPSADAYDPTASGASNLGPESIVDTLPDPRTKGDTGTPSLLTQVCARSLAVGALEHVDGSRPFCTSTGVGAVLAVFYAGPGYHGAVTRAVSLNQACPATPFLSTYRGVKVTCASYGADYSHGKVVPIRGSAPAHPAVPADAVTTSGSSLDPNISTSYARLQEPRIAKARGVGVAVVRAVVQKYTAGRDLGFLGEPIVNVLKVNVALDAQHPVADR